jgi:hypothetical protein
MVKQMSGFSPRAIRSSVALLVIVINARDSSTPRSCGTTAPQNDKPK